MYSIILLAAGSSSRFGSPKQIAEIDGKSLIRHAVSAATTKVSSVIVVLGANQEIIRNEIENLPVKVVFNKDWEEGMSSSIRTGLLAVLSEHPLTAAVIIAVCDQPFLSAALLEKLIERYQATKKPIVACSYGDNVGTPVLFDKIFFNSLLDLIGNSGAKKIVLENKDQTEMVLFPRGSVDIDTQKDYEEFLESYRQKK